MFGHPPLYLPEVWRVDPLPLREGTLTLDTLQLAAGWFIRKSNKIAGMSAAYRLHLVFNRVSQTEKNSLK